MGREEKALVLGLESARGDVAVLPTYEVRSLRMSAPLPRRRWGGNIGKRVKLM